MTAFDILAADLSVLPIDPQTKRPPVRGSVSYPDQPGYPWKVYQTHLPAEAIVRQYLNRYPGCWHGFICGEASGGLEALDFDIPGKKYLPAGVKGEAPAWQPWCDALRAHGHGELLARLVVVETRSGGRQLYYRCPLPAGNSKLASRPATAAELEANPKTKVFVLIETRGVGGLVVCPPTPGYTFIHGDFRSVPTITNEERGILWAFAASLDETPELLTSERPQPSAYPRLNGDISPGDDFDARTSWEEILEPHGYRKVGRYFGKMQLWAHPGKEKGDYSARTGPGSAGDRFYSWSPNGGVPHEQLLRKWHLHAYLNHSGDFSAAAKALAVKGFGARAERSPRTTGRSPSAIDQEDDLEGLDEFAEESPLKLPLIQWNARQLPHVTFDAISALVASNDPRHLFDRGGKVVRVVEDKEGGFKIESVGAAAMRNEIGKAANWARMNDKGKLVSGYVPKEIAENVLAEQGLSKKFPRLEGLSSVPVLSPDGAFFRSHGYDPESGFFVTSHGPFPDHPGDGRHAAAWLLEELFTDFPFEDDASRANALGLALLPYVRPFIKGPTPMHYVEAPASRTGKSLLVEVALLPAFGSIGVSSTPLPEKEEELAKTLSGKLSDGDQLVFFDNVKRRVSSSSLEQVLTALHYQFRPLGSTSSVRVPVKAIFALTTNNGTLSIDMAGRSVLIRIDAKMERPEDRSAFRHENIRAFIEANRPEIRAAFMGMVDDWVRAGRPNGTRKKASYFEWAQTIGGILDVCGVPGFLENDRNLKGTAADEEESWRGFYDAWWSEHGSEYVTGPVLLELARSRDLLQEVRSRAKGPSGEAMAFGRAMSARESKVLDGRRSTTVKNTEGNPYLRNGQKVFQLVPLEGFEAKPVQAQESLYDQGSGYEDPFEDE